MKTATIYALKDPRTLEVMYIGQTTQPLQQRLDGHMLVNVKGDRRKAEWTLELIKGGLMPIIEAIEVVEEEKALIVEAKWIKHYQSIQPELLNGIAHRPLKYGEETTPVVVRVPVSKVEAFKKLIQPILNKWIKKK